MPGERRGVADARAQTLSRERGHQVGGVTGEQHAPLAPALGPAGAEGVYGVALQRHLVGRRPRSAPAAPTPSRGLRSARRSPRQQHPLPAPPPRSARDQRRGPRGVALLQVDPREQARVVGDGVGDQPVEGEAEVLHRRAHPLTHEAVGAVAADHVGGRHLLLLAAGPPPSLRVLALPAAHPQAHVRAGVLDVDQLPALVNLDRGEELGRAVQQFLELGLAEHRRPRPARRARAGCGPAAAASSRPRSATRMSSRAR